MDKKFGILLIAIAGTLHELQVSTGMTPPDWLEALANGNPENIESVIEVVVEEIEMEGK